MTLNAWLKSTGLCAALLTAAPASAQFDSTYPDTPPAEGQTLLEWADPPILKHTIPEQQRSDVSTCGATSEYDLDFTAVTCWPVLRAAQMFLLADYAALEPTGDKQENLRSGIAKADEAIAFIGTPEWPLEEYLLIKSLELKLNAQMRLEEWDAAYDTSFQLTSAIRKDLFRFDEFRLGYAYRKQGQVLLKLGLYEAAQFVLEDAHKLLTGFDGDKVAISVSDQSEDMIVYAINQGDVEYARATAQRYLDHIGAAPRGMRFGYDTHIDLLLYLAALSDDRNAALALLKERFTNQRDYARCDDGYFKFPRVLGPMIEDEAIRQALLDGGCKASDLSIDYSAPIKGLDGKTLPPFGP